MTEIKFEKIVERRCLICNRLVRIKKDEQTLIKKFRNFLLTYLKLCALKLKISNLKLYF